LSKRIVFLPKAPGIVQAWGAVSAVAIAYVVRGAGGGTSGSAAAQGDLYTEVRKPGQA
jgi:hypothetical protein